MYEFTSAQRRQEQAPRGIVANREVRGMVDKSYAVALPDYILDCFGWKESEAPQRIREALVMELLRLDRLTEAEAAEALDLDRWQLLDVMGRYRVPAIRMTPVELNEELARSIDGSHT